MKRFRLIGAMIVAVFALASAFASSASAAFPLPTVLPTVNGNWSGKNIGTPLFLTLAKAHLNCTAATATGTTDASKVLGLFHITFTGCLLLPSTVCTGLGDTPASGVILTLGTWHTVIDVNEPNLAAALLLLLEDTHFSCGIVLLVVRGAVLCLILEPTVSKPSHEFHCTQTNGTTDEKTFLNDSGTLVAVPALLSSTSGAAFEEAGELALGTIEYTEAVKIDS